MALRMWERDNGVLFAVYVQPRATRDEIAGIRGGAVKVRLTAPPVEGKANRALVHFLAEVLGVPPRNVTVEAGERGREKRVAVTGLGAAEVRRRLQVD